MAQTLSSSYTKGISRMRRRLYATNSLSPGGRSSRVLAVSMLCRLMQTLSTVSNFRCTEEFLKKFPNLQKMVVYYRDAGMEDWSDYHLKNLVHLPKLENLKFIFNGQPNDTLLPNLSFPKTLKKLISKWEQSPLGGCDDHWFFALS